MMEHRLSYVKSIITSHPYAAIISYNFKSANKLNCSHQSDRIKINKFKLSIKSIWYRKLTLPQRNYMLEKAEHNVITFI